LENKITLIQVTTNNFSTPCYCYFSGPMCWTQSRPTQNVPSTSIGKKAIIISVGWLHHK